MFSLNDFEIGNWEDSSLMDDVCIKIKSKKDSCLPINIWVMYDHMIRDSWRIIIPMYGPFREIYSQMFGENQIFSSKQEAINRVNLFLNKIYKLKVFL